MNPQNDNTSPQDIARQLIDRRAHWISEARRFMRIGDANNAAWCQGNAVGLNEAIVLLGGEGINLRLDEVV